MSPDTFRRTQTGQPLTDDQRKDILERGVGALADAGIARRAVVVLDLGGEVPRHARHAVGAQRLDAGALDRFEHGARQAGAWSQTAMHLGVMRRDGERQAVGPAAHDRDLTLRWQARGLRQGDGLALDLGLAGAKADLNLAVAGDRADGQRERALERLGGSFLLLRRDPHGLP